MAQNAKNSFSLNQKEIWFIIHKLYYRYDLPATAIKLYFFLLHQHNRTQYVGNFTKPLISYRAIDAKYTDTQPLSISLISEKLKMPRHTIRKHLKKLEQAGIISTEISRSKMVVWLHGIFQEKTEPGIDKPPEPTKEPTPEISEPNEDTFTPEERKALMELSGEPPF